VYVSDVKLDPYIFFKGNAREAMEFYKSVFGGKLDVNEYTDKDLEMMPGTPEEKEAMKGKLMHAMLDGDVRLMASDSTNANDKAAKIELSLSGEDEATLRKYWDGLSAGGKVTMPLDKAPWGDTFGMLTDKYDISWMVNVTTPNSSTSSE
jgi:PhnB protein